MKLIIDVPEEYYKSAKLMVEKGSTYPLKVSIANGMLAPLKTRNPKTYRHCKSMQNGCHNMRVNGWQKVRTRNDHNKV